jgi:hypothetical protein
VRHVDAGDAHVVGIQVERQVGADADPDTLVWLALQGLMTPCDPAGPGQTGRHRSPRNGDTPSSPSRVAWTAIMEGVGKNFCRRLDFPS